MKIIFMGTPDFAVPALQKLIDSTHEVIAVYTQKPRSAGRGMELKRSKVHELADANNIKVFTPDNFKTSEDVENFKSLNAELAVVVAYGMLLPKTILDAPEHGCINIHPSLLPRWRGAAPLQRTIMQGDKRTAVCIMKMDEGLDTGDVISKEEFDIPENADTGWLHDKCADIGARLILKVVELIDKGTTTYTTQSNYNVTYAKKITKDDELIDFRKTGHGIINKIRGLSPYPGAYFSLDGKKYKIFKAEFLRDRHCEEGTDEANQKKTTISPRVPEQARNDGVDSIINDKFHISCADGIIMPLIIQKEGKARMDINEFLKGNKAPVSSII